MPFGYRFRPTLVPTLFAAAGAAVLISLGTWQLGRWEEAKAARITFAARLAEPPFDGDAPPEDPDQRRATVTGAPEWDHHARVAGKYMWGHPGSHLVVPVVLGSGETALVNLGWVPDAAMEDVVARERAVPGPRTWSGLARVYPEDPDARGGYAPGDRRWRAVSPRAMGATLAWVLVDGEGIPNGAAVTDRDPPVSGWRTEPVERPHGEYAFTWFSLSVTLGLVWASASMRPAVAATPPAG